MFESKEATLAAIDERRAYLESLIHPGAVYFVPLPPIKENEEEIIIHGYQEDGNYKGGF